MSSFIVEHKMGISVYGLEQTDYTVNGTAGCDYGLAVSKTALKRADAIEQALAAFTAVVRKRQNKITELSKALGAVSSAAAKFKSDDKTTASVTHESLSDAYSICSKYGVDTYGAEGNSIMRSQVQQVQTAIQYAIDTENTDMQEDMVQLQGYVDKRDSSIRLASTLLKKVNATASTGIRNIK